MSVPVSQLITGALRLIGVKAQGNRLSGEQANNALYTLNEIIDSFNVDGGMIYAEQTLTAPLANGVSQEDGSIAYTIGLGNTSFTPTFNVSQPLAYVSYATFQTDILSPSPLDLPITILSPEEYAAIRLKGIGSAISFYMYYDYQWPVGNIYLWPVPTSSAKLRLTGWQGLNAAQAMSNIINLPPAYQKLLRYELAINLAPEFNKPVPMDVSSIAATVKANIKWRNARGGRLTYSRQAQGVSQNGAYDIYTDEIR